MIHAVDPVGGLRLHGAILRLKLSAAAKSKDPISRVGLSSHPVKTLSG